jgi:superfamily II DNA or RNA helicase
MQNGIKIVVKDKVYVDISQNPELYNILSIIGISPNPLFYLRNKIASLANEPQYLFSVMSNRERTVLAFYRGLLPKILEELRVRGIPFEIEDQRVKGEPVNIFIRPSVNLFEYQKIALEKLSKLEDAVLVSECGSGKTVMGVALISAFKVSTLIIVPTLQIQQQWKASLIKITDVKRKDIGTIGQGIFNPAKITISTYQSLERLTQKELDELNGKFGCLIVDEVHRVSARVLCEVTNLSPAFYRFGFTATPKRKDQKDVLILNSISHTLVDVKSEELQKAGRLIIPSVRFVKMLSGIQITERYRWTGKERVLEKDWTDLYNRLTESDARTNIILDNVEKTVSENHICLILTNRREYCEALAKKLNERGIPSDFINGQIGKSEREMILKKVGNKIKVLVSTFQLASEGLDVPVLSCLHLISPTSNENLVKQASGRVRRAIEGKKALIVDYVDEDSKELFTMYKQRRHYYKKFGFVIEN